MTQSDWPTDEGGDAAADDYYSDAAATLGDRIAAARQAAGLKQTDLAERLGVGAKVISAWENDRAEPRANRLSMLAGMLNVSVAWLLTGAGDGVDPPEAQPQAHGAARGLRVTVAAPDLEEARRFWSDLLGRRCLAAQDRSLEFDLFGHHLRVELLEDEARPGPAGAPAIRLGFELEWTDWHALIERLRAQIAEFEREPVIESVGAPEERGAFSLRDPSGNELTFEAVRTVE